MAGGHRSRFGGQTDVERTGYLRCTCMAAAENFLSVVCCGWAGSCVLSGLKHHILCTNWRRTYIRIYFSVSLGWIPCNYRSIPSNLLQDIKVQLKPRPLLAPTALMSLLRAMWPQSHAAQRGQPEDSPHHGSQRSPHAAAPWVSQSQAQPLTATASPTVALRCLTAPRLTPPSLPAASSSPPPFLSAQGFPSPRAKAFAALAARWRAQHQAAPQEPRPFVRGNAAPRGQS